MTNQQPPREAETALSSPKDSVDLPALIQIAMEKESAASIIEQLHPIFVAERDDARRLQFQNAFSRAQATFPPIPKNRKASFPTKAGGRVEYGYADTAKVLECVLPSLTREGLSVCFRRDEKAGANELAIFAVLQGFGVSRETRFSVSASAMSQSNANDAQKAGGAATFAKRYALYDLIGVFPTDEDVDANNNSGNAVEAKKPTAKNAPAQTAAAPAGLSKSEADDSLRAARNAKIEKCTAYLRRLGTKRPIAPTTKLDAEIMVICAGALAADPIGESDSIKAFRSIDARISWATLYADCATLAALQAKLINELIDLGAPEAVE